MMIDPKITLRKLAEAKLNVHVKFHEWQSSDEGLIYLIGAIIDRQAELEFAIQALMERNNDK